MSSLKMTFSLTSLILIIALGLVVGTVPVIADDGGTAIPPGETAAVHDADGHATQDAANTAENTLAGHMHPKIAISATDADATKAGTQVVPTAETPAGDALTEAEILSIEFPVKFTLPANSYEAGGTTVPSGTTLSSGAASVSGEAFIGNASGGTFAIAGFTLKADTTYEIDAVVTITLTDPAGTPTVATAQARRDAVLASTTMPLEVTVMVAENVIVSSDQRGAYEGQTNVAAEMTFTLVAEGKEKDPDAVMFAVTGTPSLSAPFTVTFTSTSMDSDGDPVGTTLMESDIEVSSGDGFVVTNTLNDTSPSDAPMTVWQAIIQPVAGATKIFVTIKDNNARAPAADEDKGVLRISGVTLLALTASEGANDEALFVVTLTFSHAVTSLTMADLMVTPMDDPDTTTTEDAAMVGTPAAVLGSDNKMWQVEITPVKGMATTIALAKDSNLGMGSVAALTVKVKGTPPSVPDVIDAVDATYDATKDETTLTGMLAANGFAVVVAEDLPDLQRFFAEGGSISVLSAKDGAVAKDVVISEIMWGLNLRAIGDDRTAHQFIELYNTTGATIDLKDIKLTFDDANTPSTAPTGMTLLDQISNVDGVGWVITAAPGSSGRIALPDDVTTFVPSDLVSMYRKIDYAKVEKTHNADDAAANRTAQLADFPGGNAIGSWAASNAADTYGVNLIGSPGAKHFVAYSALTPTEVKRDMFIINEIGNYDNDAHDWIEIKRVGSLDNLKKWRLSQVTSDKKDTKLVSFPDSDDPKISIPAVGDVLLIVNSDPYQDPNHPLAAGIGLNAPAKDRAETTGVTSRYYVDSGLKLANSGKTLLILRNSIDDAHVGTATSIQDVVGTLSIVDNAAGLRTSLWPLVATGAPHADVINDDAPADDEDFSAGHVYVRTGDTNGTGEHSFNSVGYTGLGYKRSAANSFQNGGTPGYPNDARINTDAALSTAGGTISISEIMYAKNRSEPQWIELYNSSMTHAVNIEEWKLKIEHSRDVDDIDIRTSVTTNNFGGGITIQPNQTVLIVSNTTGRTSRSSQGGLDFPSSRVINLWAQKDKLEVASGKTRLTYRLLSQTAFRLTLLDKDGATVDVAGNLEAEPAWELPANDVGEGRSSIIRRYNEGEATSGGEGMPIDGTLSVWSGGKGAGGMAGDSGWVYAATSHLDRARFNETYYGNPDDIGTPGYRGGGPLPVSLSKFRPERLESGEVVIRWITESELNNAGFNILRSDTRNGEFTKVNTSLIAGHGTTSERNTYEWKDTSAKPNVVYYYQIQDVSLDGDVNILRQSRLKGDVSPAGKLTTTWGELKALQ